MSVQHKRLGAPGASRTGKDGPAAVTGEFVDVDGERYYVIRNVDRMPPFFVSVISSADHWLFALFLRRPDRRPNFTGNGAVFRMFPSTGSTSAIRTPAARRSCGYACRTGRSSGAVQPGTRWPLRHQPQSLQERPRQQALLRGDQSRPGPRLPLYVGHQRPAWFRAPVRTSQPRDATLRIELVDGLQNILPAGTPMLVQANSSNLVDAYKWTELDAGTGLAMYALYSRISDRAEPAESLRAHVVYGLGLDAPTVLLSSLQLDDFRLGKPMAKEERKRASAVPISSQPASCFRPRVAAMADRGDVGRTQGQVVDIIRRVADPAAAAQAVARSVDAGCDELARIMAAADGFQCAAEEPVRCITTPTCCSMSARRNFPRPLPRAGRRFREQRPPLQCARLRTSPRTARGPRRDTGAGRPARGRETDRRPATGKAVPGVPADHVRPPSRRSESPMEHVCDQAQGRSGRAPAVL